MRALQPTPKTLKVRVRDKHARKLREMAVETNFVWNYCNELAQRSIVERGVFMSGFDFQKYISGAFREFSYINQGSIEAVSQELASRRKKARKQRLRWRRSFGARRSLGWVPLKARSIRWKCGQVQYAGHHFSVWDSYGLSQYKFRAGCFTEDARGRWYFCVAVDTDDQPTKGQDRIGIDLGLKDIATTSDGERLQAGQWYRNQQGKLGIAQRARRKNRVRAIHAKIANRRKDTLHKFSRSLVNRCGEIYVGNVSSSALKKTNMAKSVSDAGWASLKTMLGYKCEHAGIVYKVVNEAYTTQTCSSCGAIPDSSPKGRVGLGVRDWTCDRCGARHDRDINAARNVLALGLRHGPPAEGIATQKSIDAEEVQET